MGTLVQKNAPDFRGQALVGKEFKQVSLGDYRGKWLVLFFYPLDFTFVCPTEIIAISDRVGDFKELGAEVVGCSVDSHFCHLAWSERSRQDGGIGEIDYPLLSDLSRQISTDYGVLNADGTLALRGLFIIDPDGIVRYQVVHDLGIGRNVDETLRVLAATQFHMKTGDVCPMNWTPGSKTMKADPEGSKEYFASQ